MHEKNTWRCVLVEVYLITGAEAHVAKAKNKRTIGTTEGI